MDTDNAISILVPRLSIVIAVYNDWTLLDHCLRSLADQATAPTFEVIVVDDGSTEQAPAFILLWKRYFQLTLIRQEHAGIPAARNCGVRKSRGAMLLFVDADSRLQAGCLEALLSIINGNPNQKSFQLRLVGDCSNLAGRAEHLRLIVTQKQMLQSNGHIRYLNTAGFAIRREACTADSELFDPLALRAEDTLLLVNLIHSGEMPLLVSGAVVQHAVPMTVGACLRKDIRTARLATKTYDIIAATGIKIRIGHRERLSMLISTWKASAQQSIGRPAWFLLVARQLLERATSLTCQVVRKWVLVNG